MRIPLITSRYQDLGRRKGGGGGGKGGGSGAKGGTGGSSGSSSSSSGGESNSKTSKVPITGSSASGKSTATAYGSGGGKSITIPTGQLFAGRTAGGATRGEMYGTRAYGSGYPGYSSYGVAGRGFPFWYWPVVWGASTNPYYHDPEYGDSSNSSRTGGPMAQANFVSNSTGSTFHLLSDNSTISSLISSIHTNCSSNLSSSSSNSSSPYNSSAPGGPQPEQAIQYYRSSSVVLTLDGYNNSATFSSNINPNTTDTPLPSSGVDMTLLNCLNYTIGQAAPLIDGASSLSPPCLGFAALVWLAWFLAHYV
ncbi:hypothetical protein DEU56DRAFT_733692 [Suillus clintonianus]|uniref:uncharacterized protein n=1 Tax=Suillus clintonianus TaxID=1904413 RepID=UPI001B86B366|nr:uncharacterized protein DEU56DRAFT_733692 [Suillus clintonianus]KAG2142375.1 hypothetical protein DEU56DRAFT_733692 [Suillus clintonianus]